MASKKSPTLQPTVALCYVRQSYTRDADDRNSPERQRNNIQVLCERNGWQTEWYEDAQGHKSGRHENNRPGWLALKNRLDDPDVVAVVANDLSRLHRKGWRVGDLVEHLDRKNISLVLAAPGREIDTKSPTGRLFIMFAAIIDEYYAEDISQRAKDSILYRKRQGKVVGLPPFGTTRNEAGYLIPSTEGAWWLHGGQFIAGEPYQRPSEGAIWRSYYDCALYMLTLFAQGDIGLEKISYRLNIEGWPFRDRNGQPRPVTREDIRRVVSNWPEYGGVVIGTRGKDRPAYENNDVNEIHFNIERAVFPVDLLRDVASVRQERSVRPVDQSLKREAVDYPLSVITYCAHCEARALAQNNPKLRTVLSGKTDDQRLRRYVHKPGVKCGCSNRSVRCDLLEEDFGRLIKLLDIDPNSRDLLLELAIQTNDIGDTNDIDVEEQKQEAIALCQRRIDATVTLYSEGRIDYSEYRRRIDQNEREMAHWQSRTTETEKAALELALCIEAVKQLAMLWDISSDTDRKGMARNLFEYLIYDLDTRRIVAFRLKAWAERFLVVRAALYEADFEAENKTSPVVQGEGNDMPPRGFEPLFWP